MSLAIFTQRSDGAHEASFGVCCKGRESAPAPSQGVPRAPIGEILRRLPSTEELEGLFSRLRGVDLVLATLSYGLGVRVSDLRGVRIRDINLASHRIVIDGVARAIPLLVADDLRDLVHEKVCGSEASITVSRREQRLFSEGELQEFFCRLSDYQKGANEGMGEAVLLTERCLNRIFRVLARFHVSRAALKGGRIKSALELFDKGPRIVRRGRWGAVDAYYLWRTAYPCCA